VQELDGSRSFFGLRNHQVRLNDDFRKVVTRFCPSDDGIHFHLPVGFIMARVDLGEFGRIETTAVIDTIGVDPDYQNKGVGRALVSQLLANLGTLRVEKVRTEVDWQDHDLLAYLHRSGFRPSQQLCFDQPLV
jgi:ribosomal protein S18 acetylase RimI-like enzyme